jgi:xanthine/uracil/vitamin C permease (AzgA family)
MQNLDEVEFSVTNKNFSYIGYILLFISVSIIFSSLFSISPTEEYLITNVGLGIIGSMVGVFFILYGLKKKQILIGNNNLIYFSSGKKCVISFQSIEYIHTFYDKTNHSTNLLILFDKDQSISFSSSF